MSNTLNILILAGASIDETRQEGDFPNYLSELNGATLIQSLIDKCPSINPKKIICMFPSKEVQKYHLRNMVSQMHSRATVHPVQEVTMGAACTALLASETIDNDAELVILGANEILDDSLDKIITEFRNKGCDAGVVIFKSLHPRYAFVRLNETGDVVEVAEKNPISPHAVAGIHWFKSGKVFVEGVKNMIRKDAKVNGQFYIAPALNELVLLNKKVGAYRVEPTQYHPLKNATQTHNYEMQGGWA